MTVSQFSLLLKPGGALHVTCSTPPVFIATDYTQPSIIFST